MNRRSFLAGVGSLFAAPAIVHAGNLMPIKVIPFQPYMLLRGFSMYETHEIIEVRLTDDISRPDAFLSPQFFDQYQKAASKFVGCPDQVGIAWTREDEKSMRMIEPVRPAAFQPIRKHSVAWDGDILSFNPVRK